MKIDLLRLKKYLFEYEHPPYELNAVTVAVELINESENST